MGYYSPFDSLLKAGGSSSEQIGFTFFRSGQLFCYMARVNVCNYIPYWSESRIRLNFFGGPCSKKQNFVTLNFSSPLSFSYFSVVQVLVGTRWLFNPIQSDFLLPSSASWIRQKSQGDIEPGFFASIQDDCLLEYVTCFCRLYLVRFRSPVSLKAHVLA